ncbi:thiamine pyrophosphate-binding protein [Aciditerrimonas ferrireducens]|uniref:Thiamine pyrophosphate-binding protein n=1 Tax=Aciditerrimonas ferrireducens TaxID=667306 RepID=A0ABV6C3F7_9ACTN
MTTVAEALVDVLEAEQVPFVAGIPGGGVMDVLDALQRPGAPRYVLVRHEQVAAHMALGYAELTGRPAAVLVSRSPGAANTVIGLQAAFVEGSPLVLLSSQVSSRARGLGAFQEIDLEALFRPITKWSVEVRAPERVPEVVEEAFRVAVSGRPGPVHVAIPLDFPGQNATHRASPPSWQLVAPLRPDPEALDRAAALLARAARPVVVAGGGVTKARAADEVTALAELLGAAVANTWEKKALREDLDLAVGTIGRGGAEASATALKEADVVLAIGVRFSEFATEDYRLRLRPDQALIQVDVDAPTIGRVLPVAIGVLGDARLVARELTERLRAAPTNPERASWRRRVADLRTSWLETVAKEAATPSATGQPTTAQVASALRRLTRVDAVVCTDSGNFNYDLARHFRARVPGAYLYPAGAGPMGCGLPAAMGVKAAFPERQVVAVAGDGGFAMTVQDLETCVRERLDVVAVVINNFSYGNIKVRQRHRHPEAPPFASELGNPDYGALARLFGAHGETVERAEDLEGALTRALAVEGPAVVDVHVDPEEMSAATVGTWW